MEGLCSDVSLKHAAHFEGLKTWPCKFEDHACTVSDPRNVEAYVQIATITLARSQACFGKQPNPSYYHPVYRSRFGRSRATNGSCGGCRLPAAGCLLVARLPPGVARETIVYEMIMAVRYEVVRSCKSRTSLRLARWQLQKTRSRAQKPRVRRI